MDMIKQIASAFGVDPEGLELVSKESEMNIKEIARKFVAEKGAWGSMPYDKQVEVLVEFAAEVQRQNKPVAYARFNELGHLIGLFEGDDTDKSRSPLFTIPPSLEDEPLTDSFVQTVPDKCDRIVWRGNYLHLPINIESEREKVAEACAAMLENGSFLSRESIVALAANGAAKAIRQGKWKEFASNDSACKEVK